MSAASPIDELRAWLADAARAALPEADAMILATADSDAAPSARVVSCRGIDEEGIRFFTSYDSRKGGELATNPRAAVVFFWPALRRQARVEGSVARLPEAASDAYFRARPRARQIAACASPQSRIIASLDEVRARAAEVERAHLGRDVTRPLSWGGYLLRPLLIELWRGGESRMHERRLFRLRDRAWTEQRLAP